MRLKLKLNLERLNVESFQTENVSADKGTVHAYGTIRCSRDPENTCAEETCQAVVSCLGETCTGCDTAYKCYPLDTEEVCVFTLYCG